MNYLRKIAIALALVAGLSVGAWAQSWGHRDAARHWDNHPVYHGQAYAPYLGGWGYVPNRGWDGYYPYRNYGYYPYGAYGYYPNRAYGYYPYNYGYYPGGWGYPPNFVLGFHFPR